VAPDRTDQPERNDKEHDERLPPGGEDPAQHQIDAEHAEQKADHGLVEKILFLHGQATEIPFEAVALGNSGQNVVAQGRADFSGTRRVAFGQCPGNRDKPASVLAVDR